MKVPLVAPASSALESLLGGGVGAMLGAGAGLAFAIPPAIEAGVGLADRVGGFGAERWQKIIDAQGRSAAMGAIPRFLEEQNVLRDSRFADMMGSIPHAQGSNPYSEMGAESNFMGSLEREHRALLQGMAARYTPDQTGAFLSRIMQEYQPQDRF